MKYNYKKATPYSIIFCIIWYYLVSIFLLNFTCKHFLSKTFSYKFFNPIALYKLTSYFFRHNDQLNFYPFGHISGLSISMGSFSLFAPIISTIIAFMFTSVLFAPKASYDSDRYGTAKFQNPDDVVNSNKTDNPVVLSNVKKHGRPGVFIGTIEHKSGKNLLWDKDKKLNGIYKHLRELYHFGSQHIFLYAPTGAGKGVGLVFPILVTYPSSIFCYDIKGENYLSTSGYRKKSFDNVILKFEPSCAKGTSVRYNPLEEVRIGTLYEVVDAQKLALALIDQKGDGLKEHWDRKAYTLLTGIILHVCYTKKKANLNSVVLFMSGVNPDTGESYASEKEWLSEMCGMNGAFVHLNGYATKNRITPEEARQHFENLEKQSGSKMMSDDGINIVIMSAAVELVNKDGKAEGERSSIISTMSGHLGLYSDPVVAMNTEVSDFKLVDLQNYNKPVSFYLVIPNDQRERLNPLVRLLITQLIQKIQATHGDKVREILFLLDEFPELKKLADIESALATIRGYDTRMVLIAQDYTQLTKFYGDSQTITSNCGVQIAYAPNDLKTAKMLSEYAGTKTYSAETISKTINGGNFDLFKNNGSRTISTQETSRPLLTTDEVRALGDNALIFVEQERPILSHKFKWFIDPDFKKKIYYPKDKSNPGNDYYPPLDKSEKITSLKE